MLLELLTLAMLWGPAVAVSLPAGEVYEVTAYCEDTITARGNTPVVGFTCAVDPRMIPLGSIIYIEGVGVGLADDTGGAVKHNVIDRYMSDYDTCINWGRRDRRTWIIIRGD